MSRPASHATVIATQLAMDLRLTARRSENVLVTVVIPAAVLVFFASVPVLAVEPDSGRAVDFLLPGSIALGVIATSLVNLGIATAYERHYGVLKRLGGSPLGRGDLVVARLATVLAVEVLQVLLLVGIAVALLGWRPPPGVAPIVALIAVLLGTGAFAGIGLLLAGTLRAEATLALANGLFLAFLLLGGVVQPVDQLPGPLAALAALLPAAPLSEALRIALGASTGDPVGPLALLGGWAVGSIAAAVRLFRWD